MKKICVKNLSPITLTAEDILECFIELNGGGGDDAFVVPPPISCDIFFL